MAERTRFDFESPARSSSPSFLFVLLSCFLVLCAGALAWGEYSSPVAEQPDAVLARPLAGYLTNDAFTLASLTLRLTTGAINWQTAAANFRIAVPRDAASPQRWCELGEALAKSGDVRDAAKLLERVF